MSRSIALLGLLGMSLACGGTMPDDLGPEGGRLAPCPDSPNCVSSFAEDERHAIAPIEIRGSSEAAWEALVETLEAWPRVEIVTRNDDYLHAVFTTALMRYRDDVEFLSRPNRNEIAVRSASRVGYGDMGANRARVEALRAALADRGVAASSPRE